MIRWLLFLILIALVAAGLYFWLGRSAHIEKALTRALGTKVTIERVDLSLTSLTLRNLKVANPAGSALPYAFQGGEISVTMNPFTLWKQSLPIQEVTIIDPTFSIVLNNASGTDNNWVQLLARSPSKKSSKTYTIDTLLVKNLRFEGIRANQKPLTIPPIPELILTDLGPSTLSQIGLTLFGSILKTLTLRPQLGRLLEQLPSLTDDILQKALPEGVFEKGAQQLKQKTEEAVDFLERLFSR